LAVKEKKEGGRPGLELFVESSSLCKKGQSLNHAIKEGELKKSHTGKVV